MRVREFVMGDDETTPQTGEEPARSCQRCTNPMQLITVLPRVGEHPSYRILGCTACTFLEWIAEHVGS